MQTTYSSWMPTVSPPQPKLQISISKLATFPTKLIHTQNSRHHYLDGEDNDAEDTDTSLPFKSPLPPLHVKSITSTANPFVKHCVRLQKSSPYRHSQGSVVVVGSTPIREIHSFQESLPERTAEIECLFVLDKANVPEGLDESSVRTLRASALVMRRLSQLQSTESIDAIALMKFPTSYFVANDDKGNAVYRKWFPLPHRILVLEGIQDPGNLGTLVRSAVAFKWGGIFLLPGCCDPFCGKALKASRGASFQVPIVSGSWHHLKAMKDEFKMKMLAGHPESDDGPKQVSQLSQKFADSLADVPLLLVLGNEGHGLTERSLQECDLVCIPMAGEFESLNVAVAGGIFLYTLQPKNWRE